MNKDRDFQIYQELEAQVDPLHKKKVVYSRILKLSSTKSSTSYEKLGVTFARSGIEQLEKCLIPFKRAIIINPQKAIAHTALINAFFRLKKENEAFSAMKRALCLSPRDHILHSFMIRTFQERATLEDLESFYQQTANMITDKKLVPDLFYQCAQTLTKLNQYPQALISYKKAIETRVVDEPEYIHHYQYGMALYHEGFFEEAIVQFEHAWRLNPAKNLAKNNIAYLHYCLGRVQKAFEEFEYIIENGLEMYATYSNFLVVLHHLDKDEETTNKYKDRLQPYIQSKRHTLIDIYKEELRQVELRLQGDIDEENKEFYTKKLQGLNRVISLIN